MSVERFEISNLNEFANWVKTFSARLRPKQVVLLEGAMGAGKTKFTQILVEVLGGDVISSPSFAIHNEYEISAGVLDHLDLYRLEDEDDLESTGFWDLFIKDKGLIVIEWADRLQPEFLPRDWDYIVVKIQFSSTGAEARTIEVEAL